MTEHDRSLQVKCHREIDFFIKPFRNSVVVHQQASIPLARVFVFPLTSAPFGHDNQRRHAEQHRLAPGYPAAAAAGRRRHPAGDGSSSSLHHAADTYERLYAGGIIPGIFHPGNVRSPLLLLLLLLLLPLPAPLSKYMTSLHGLKGHQLLTVQSAHEPSLCTSSSYYIVIKEESHFLQPREATDGFRYSYSSCLFLFLFIFLILGEAGEQPVGLLYSA